MSNQATTINMRRFTSAKLTNIGRPIKLLWPLLAGLSGVSAIVITESLSSRPLLLYLVMLPLCYVLYFLAYRRFNGKLHVTDPAVFAVIAMGYYSLVYPLDVYFDLVVPHPLADVEAAAWLYFVANLALLCTLLLLAMLLTSGKRTRISVVGWRLRSSPKVTKRLAQTAVVVGLILFAYDTYRIGGLQVLGISNRVANFIAQRTMAESLLAIPYAQLMTAGFLMWCMTVSRSKERQQMWIVLISIVVLYLLGFGSRASALMLFLPVLALEVDRWGLPRWAIMTGCVLAGFFISPIFSNLRNHLIFGFPLADLPPQAWALSKGEGWGAFEITALVAGQNSFVGVDVSYVTSFLRLLPASIFSMLVGESKPLRIDDWVAMVYYPGHFAQGVTVGFSPVAQAWMNGGFLAIVLFFIALGMLVSVARYNQILRYSLLPYLIWIQRVELSSFLWHFGFTLLFCYAILVAAALLAKH